MKFLLLKKRRRSPVLTAAKLRLRVEQLEVRLLMASDLANASGLLLQDSWLQSPSAESSGNFAMASASIHDPYAEDTREPSEVYDETHWVLRMDSAAASELIELATPAVLGEFTPQALSFTTLANGMPILNSLPGSPTSVFLDFDGDATTSTDAYDVDSAPTTFNAVEQRTIAEAWRHIATYFAMFDTNVTTIEPPVAQPKAWAAIGNNITGGYCFVNTFPNTQPRCFNQSGDARTRQSGIAHEVGHNFGLNHQSDFDLFGFETADYSRGVDELHVPIMGVDFAPRIRKFIIGHTSDASVLQDDIAVIASDIKARQPAGGDGFRADDYQGTIATATPLTFDSDVHYVSGIIERLTDVDAFSFASNGLPLSIRAAADTPSGVDLKLEIYDASGVLLAAKDGALNDQEIVLTLASGTYYALVSGHRNYGDVGTYNLTVRTLPEGWVSQDVGAVGIPGFSQFNSADDTFTLGASGADVAGTADEMQFAMQTLTGNGTIVAKVNSITNTNANAMAGVAIRETTAGNARHVSLATTWSSGARFTRRTTVGGTSTTTTTTAAAFTPVWVRLTRVGNVFTAATSPNGIAWTSVGTSQTVTMGATVQIGLFSSARNDAAISVATFSDVSVTGSLGISSPTPNSLPAPTEVTVTRSTGSDLTVTWTNQDGETGYRVEKSEDGVVFTTEGTTAADVTTYVDTGLIGSMRYFYRVLALDATGASEPSAIVSQINRPSAVTRLELTSLDQSRIVLDWIETSGETGYRIDRSLNGITYTTIATVGANIPSYTNTGLANATAYFYRVTPTSALGDGVAAEISGATRMAQVAGLAFSSIAGNSISLVWNDLTTELGYKVQRSTDGTNFTDRATLPGGTTTYTDSTVTPGNEYYYRVVGTAGDSISLFNLVFTATPTVAALPVPWSANDIGTVSGSGVGSTTYSGTTFKVISSGTTISGTSDSFRFTHQRLFGDGSITARVASLEDTNGTSTRFGVMFREALNVGSRYAMMALREGNTGTAQFSSRATAGVSATTASDVVRNAPYWVRVTRVGNLFTGFTSPDGTTWTQIGTPTNIAMPSLVYVGLAASSGITTELNTATATNVSVIGETRNASIAGRQVFYNNALGFGTSDANNAPTVNPVNAIDPTKTALLPGQTATTANYTNYSRGLNGFIVDLTTANNLSAIDAASFQFATWSGFVDSIPSFLTINPAAIVSTFTTGGTGGSGRVKIVLPDNVVQNAWLRITVLANALTGLAANDVFYFGNARFDVTPTTPFPSQQITINILDTNLVRANQGLNPGLVSNIFDVDRNGVVNILDTNTTRGAQGTSSLWSFTAPSSQLPLETPQFLSTPILDSRNLRSALRARRFDTVFASINIE
ncbi:MAG: fibronectin type III domain-containing protein [Planctomycetota bacterium]|nr:fibronectin type III domain-containing protein [Planctomycetota bacterium]